jgi:nucleoside-diphosphate-sugar epimerase
MKILLFGGSGFLSGKIVDKAIGDGHSVIAITRGEREIVTHNNLRHVCFDRNVIDQNELARLLAGMQWDVVIDSICRTPEHAQQSISLAKDCRRLIMVSTDYVYSPKHRKLNQNEDDAVFSDGESYGANKRKAELEIMAANKTGEVDATILRPPHIYGPGSNPGTIPNHGRRPELLDYIEKEGILQLVQGGIGLIQPVFVDDLVRIILNIIPLELSFGQVFNSPGHELMTHVDYYKEIGKCLGKKVKIETLTPELEKKLNLFPCGHRYYDTSKIMNLLPSFKYTPFKKGIQLWVQELKKNMEVC